MKNQFTNFKLDTTIIKSLDNLNYNKPSKVQIKVIPKLLENNEVIVKSKTGSGKTASFGIPICEKINVENNSVQALIIVPTRELALQVKEEIGNIGRLKKVRCSAIFGKQSMKEQIHELKQRVHIVVATPGRIIDHLERETINVENLKYFIIDEADKMLNKGFIEQIENILKHTPKEVCMGLFSATIEDDIKYICNKYMGNPISIEIEENNDIKRKQIEEYIIKVDNNKYETLKRVIYNQNPKSIIIFCNTKDEVKKIYSKMKADDFSVCQIHGDMSQDKRIFVVDDFKKGKYRILISTDVSARGIHIDDISLVINYDVPRDKENYVHRIGRTGRKDRFGKAIMIVDEKSEKYLLEIQDYIGYKIEEFKNLETSDYKLDEIKFKEYQRKLQNNKSKNKSNKQQHSEVTRFYLNAGKKKKIRLIDIVGAINNLDGINNEDIGVIEVQDLCSYVDILNNKGNIISKKYRQIEIKKKSVKIKVDNKR